MIVGYFIARRTGVVIALIISLLMNFGSYWYSDTPDRATLMELMNRKGRNDIMTDKRNYVKVPITLQEAMRLCGIEDWTLSQAEQACLIRSTMRLIQEHGEHWILKNQEGLQKQLEAAFSLL